MGPPASHSSRDHEALSGGYDEGPDANKLRKKQSYISVLHMLI